MYEEFLVGWVLRQAEERLCRVLEDERAGQGSSSAKGLRQGRALSEFIRRVREHSEQEEGAGGISPGSSDSLRSLCLILGSARSRHRTFGWRDMTGDHLPVRPSQACQTFAVGLPVSQPLCWL